MILKNCKHCGRKIPESREFCDSECEQTYNERILIPKADKGEQKKQIEQNWDDYCDQAADSPDQHKEKDDFEKFAEQSEKENIAWHERFERLTGERELFEWVKVAPEDLPAGNKSMPIRWQDDTGEYRYDTGYVDFQGGFGEKILIVATTGWYKIGAIEWLKPIIKAKPLEVYTGWISAGDRLPEVAEIVKVKHTHSEKEAIAWKDIDGEWQAVDSIGRSYPFYDVFNYESTENPITHWQPFSNQNNIAKVEVYNDSEELELLRLATWNGWLGAASAYRLYPDQKHTFSDYWTHIGEEKSKSLIKKSTHKSITNEEIQKMAEEKYPLDNPRKNMFHDNSGQYSRRAAFIAGCKAILNKQSIK